MNLVDGKSASTSGGAWKTADVAPDKFPAGLRVLVVDDDPTCLMILERMLLACLYKVTKCNRAETALSLLRQEKNSFDVVLSDVHMPDMDGFKLLEHIGLEMDLPVIMMSADDGKDVVMKGVTHGACDYLIKPVRIEALKTIWQHVVRKRKNEWKESESVDDGEPRQQLKHTDDADNASSGNEGSWRSSKKRKDEEEEIEDRDDSSTLKKPRVVWSVELHQQFVAAVHQLGIDKAVPKKILEMMNVPGLTRENVASHLQKYRLYLRRLSGVSLHQNGLNNSFMTSLDTSFGHMTSINGFDFQSLSSASCQFAAQNLGRSSNKSGVSLPFTDERNLFSFENPKLHQHQQQISNTISKQVNLLHGIPSVTEAKQLPNFHMTPHSYACMNMQVNTPGNHCSKLSMLSSSLGQPKNGIVENGGGTGFNTLSQCSSIVNLSMNHNGGLQDYPLGTPPGISSVPSKGVFQIDIKSDIKRPVGFAPGYDIFNQSQQKTHNWEVQNVGLAFDASSSHILPSVIVKQQDLKQQDFSYSQNSGQNTILLAGEVGGPHMNVQNLGQQFNSALVEDPPKFVKSEKAQDSNFGTIFFQEQFGQEDLMSALLKQQGGAGLAEPEFDFDGYSIDNISV